VYIYTLGTTTEISGLEDENGDPLANPFTGGSDGRIVVAAPTGTYSMRVVKGSFDSTQVVQFLDVQDQVDAAQLAETNAESSATAAAASAVAAAEIVNISEVQTFTNPLAQAVRVAMTAASSGSNGIRVANSPNINPADGDFTISRKVGKDTWVTGASYYVFYQYLNADNRGGVFIDSLGGPSIFYKIGGVTIIDKTGLALTVLDNDSAEITWACVRESVGSDGAVSIYVNGVQHGPSLVIPAAATVSLAIASSLYFDGTASERYRSEFYESIFYNRALSASEVLDLAINGPALADMNGSQVNRITGTNADFSGASNWSGTAATVTMNYDSGDAGHASCMRVVSASESNDRAELTGTYFGGSELLAGLWVTLEFDYKVINNASVADAVNVNLSANTIGAMNYSGVGWQKFSATSLLTSSAVSPLRLYVNGISGAIGNEILFDNLVLKRAGITGQWDAKDAQSNTGQIFDSSGNKNHALLPESGATIIGRPVSQTRQVRWTNTWAGTHELQYIGGTNQAILPAKAKIESIVGVISGATVEDVIVGDGSDGDRYVAITTGLAAGTKIFTLTATPFTDGTNLKLTVDPDANSNMSIAWVIAYTVLES
jgi:hypothetical protein